MHNDNKKRFAAADKYRFPRSVLLSKNVFQTSAAHDCFIDLPTRHGDASWGEEASTL